MHIGLGPSYGSTCQLDPGAYDIGFGSLYSTTPIQIGRSNIYVRGTPGDAGAVVLRRIAEASPTQAIMNMSGAQTDVYVQYLTFDGNRYNTQNCWNLVAKGQNYFDLDLSQAGFAAVQYDNFINAPVTALALGGSANTSKAFFYLGWSNFG